MIVMSFSLFQRDRIKRLPLYLSKPRDLKTRTFTLDKQLIKYCIPLTFFFLLFLDTLDFLWLYLEESLFVIPYSIVSQDAFDQAWY